MDFDRCPLIANPPPLVLDVTRISMLDLGRRDYMFSNCLPPAALVLSGARVSAQLERA